MSRKRTTLNGSLSLALFLRCLIWTGLLLLASSSEGARPLPLLLPWQPLTDTFASLADALIPDRESQLLSAQLAMNVLPYAELSEAVYEGKLRVGGWLRKRDLVDFKSGFHGSVYVNGAGQTAIVFQGTRGWNDWLTDVQQLVGTHLPRQYEQAENFVQEAIAKYGLDHCILAGHSLGGGLAQFTAARMGLKAYTFNPAGLVVGLPAVLSGAENRNQSPEILHVIAAGLRIDKAFWVGSSVPTTRADLVARVGWQVGTLRQVVVATEDGPGTSEVAERHAIARLVQVLQADAAEAANQSPLAESMRLERGGATSSNPYVLADCSAYRGPHGDLAGTFCSDLLACASQREQGPCEAKVGRSLLAWLQSEVRLGRYALVRAMLKEYQRMYGALSMAGKSMWADLASEVRGQQEVDRLSAFPFVEGSVTNFQDQGAGGRFYQFTIQDSSGKYFAFDGAHAAIVESLVEGVGLEEALGDPSLMVRVHVDDLAALGKQTWRGFRKATIFRSSPTASQASQARQESAKSTERQADPFGLQMVLISATNDAKGLGLEPFCLSSSEVTQSQWHRVMGHNPSQFKGEALPVETVSWDDAQEFLSRLSGQTGSTFRLPSEREWERAATMVYGQGGKDTGWHLGNSDWQTHVVREWPPNILGLHDMAGNVAEWCGEGPSTVPKGAVPAGDQRVARGGSWGDDATAVGAAAKAEHPKGFRDSSIGFRVASSDLNNCRPRISEGMSTHPSLSVGDPVTSTRGHPPSAPPTTAVPASPERGTVFTEPVTGMTFVWIPGGCFQMGSSETEAFREKDEGPVHRVCVDGFWMSQYEVTNANYRKLDPTHDGGRAFGRFSLNEEGQPASVSWNRASKFADWLSRSTGKTCRLPYEAEWEYAARGGTSTRNYWGNDFSIACEYENLLGRGEDQTRRSLEKESGGFASHVYNVIPCDDGNLVPSRVGSFKPNPFGLYDMIGNEQEWCLDWYREDYYAAVAGQNPRGPDGGERRVVRGGSAGAGMDYARSASRSAYTPNENWWSKSGFRLVIEAD